MAWSVVIHACHLVSGSDMPDDVNLSAKAFLDSYLMHCDSNTFSEHPSSLKLNVVCRDEKKFSPLKKMLMQAIDARSKPKASPTLQRQTSKEIQRPPSEVTNNLNIVMLNMQCHCRKTYGNSTWVC